ncbi:MAG: hypothetical protein R3F56_12440 [Planctomycetota bacterium]
MSESPAVERLIEKALAARGSVPLESILAELVPVPRLRAVVQERGVSPKGFRVEAAPAAALAQALVRDLDPELLKVAISELVAATKPTPIVRSGPVRKPAAEPTAEAATKSADELAVELERARAHLAAAVAAQQRNEARGAELDRRVAQQEQTIASLRGELASSRTRQADATPASRDDQRETERRLRAAESELEVLARAEEDYRRRLAEQQTAMRALEQRNEELEEMVPKNRRRRPPPPPPPPPAERFRIPHLTADFYRSLAGRDQRTIEATFDAIWRFATSGYSYPGLEVKQLEGVDLWSMRAGIKVRVYFRPRADGDVDILAAGDREEQDTLLRRLR